MAEYIKVQNIGQGFYGIEYDATALGNLDNSTTSPALKPIFKTETFDTKSASEVFIKYNVADAESYTWVIDSSPKVTDVTVAHSNRFQISVYTYLGDEWLNVYSRGNFAIGTYVLKFRNDEQAMVCHQTYENYRVDANDSIIIGSKTYIQVEPTAVNSDPFNALDVWDWVDGGNLVAGDNGSFSGFVEIGSFSVWLNNKEEF